MMLLTRSCAPGFLLTGLVAAFSGGAVAQAQSAPQAAAAPAAPEGTTDAAALLARAIALHQSGDIEGAVAAYEQILKLAPHTPRLRSNLAEVYARLGRYDEAIDQYKRELAVDPNHFDANLLLGDLLREGGQPAEALVYLTRAARLRGDDLAVQFSLGAAYVALGRTAEALPLLKAVAAAAPDHLQTHMQLAIVYHRMGRTEDAARERATMGKLQSESEKAYFQGVSRALATLFGKSAAPDPAAPLLRAMAVAESSLRDGEIETAESHYRSALQEGWQLMGDLATVEGRLTEARDAFRAASVSAVENRRALQSLVLAHLQLREAAQAVDILRRLLSKNPGDLPLRKLLAQALVANGQTGEAVQELEEAYAGAPDDAELAFTLALGYLRLKKVDLAERLFAKVVEARPIPQTRVLIGRTYRDFGDYERARVELRAALAMEPRVRRAHYHLGMLALAQRGSDPEEAIAEFQAELKLAPEDPAASLELGIALVDAQRPQEALPALERRSVRRPRRRSPSTTWGACQGALDRTEEAARTLERALELARGQGAGDRLLRLIHNQLATALRALGRGDEAVPHFVEAKRLWGLESDAEKRQLDSYLTGQPDPDTGPASVAALVEESPLSGLTPAQRVELGRRVRGELARAYLNLGVMQAQAEHFARAVEHLEKAAEIDPEFPRVQYSLGVAYFNARQFDKASRSAVAGAGGEPVRLRATAHAGDELHQRGGLRAGGHAAARRPGAWAGPLAGVRVRPGPGAERTRGGGGAGLLEPARQARRVARAGCHAGPGSRAGGRLRGGDRDAEARAGGEARRGRGQRDARRHLPEARQAARGRGGPASAAPEPTPRTSSRRTPSRRSWTCRDARRSRSPCSGAP